MIYIYVQNLAFGYQKIDSGQPWIIFWILNIISMINDQKFKVTSKHRMALIQYLSYLQNPV